MPLSNAYRKGGAPRTDKPPTVWDHLWVAVGVLTWFVVTGGMVVLGLEGIGGVSPLTETTQGTVVKSWRTQYVCGTSPRRRTCVDRKFQARYEVGGREFELETTGSYTQGDTVRIWYDPAAPEVASATSPESTALCLTPVVALGVLGFGGGLYLVFAGRRT